mmetsp:Transcript_11604/g.49515  ORF Transcript_11604/g.49515 Transcript_11604/m.49515 type:complete len:326 (-) Transcript_11604:714-1691(-)
MTFPGARRRNSSATRRAATRRPPRRQPLHPPTPSTPRLLSRNTCASSSWTSSTRRASSRSSPRTNTTRSPTRKATRTTGPTRRRRRRNRANRARRTRRAFSSYALFRRATRQSSTATITNTVYHKHRRLRQTPQHRPRSVFRFPSRGVPKLVLQPAQRVSQRGVPRRAAEDRLGVRHHERLAHPPHLRLGGAALLAHSPLHERGVVQELEVPRARNLHAPAVAARRARKVQVVGAPGSAVAAALAAHHHQRRPAIAALAHRRERGREPRAQRRVHGVVHRVQKARRAHARVLHSLQRGDFTAARVADEVHSRVFVVAGGVHELAQ